MPPPSTKQRILGALVGVHAGDAYGAPFEFQSWAQIRDSHPDGRLPRDLVGGGVFSWPPGHATDDTDLTRAVLLAYADAAAAPAPASSSAPTSALAVARAAGNYMLDWFDGRWPDRRPGTRPVDVGRATSAGLARFRASSPSPNDDPAARDPRRAGAGPGASGNGSLMRCIPTALFAADEDALVVETALVSALTHDDPHCVLACVAYNVLVRALVFADATPQAAVAAALAALDPEGPVVRAAFVCLSHDDGNNDTPLPVFSAAAVAAAIEAGRSRLDLRAAAAAGPSDAASGALAALPGRASGYVLESLTLAVAAVLDAARPLPAVLADVVRIGSDTDTNAAVAGGLLGARDGVQAIPAGWRAQLQFSAEFAEIVDRLVPA